MAISLQKRSELAMISLVKAGEQAEASGTPLGDVEANVILVIDRSGSMEFPENRFYTRGQIQELSERVLGLSMTGLDADRKVQVFPFDDRAYEPFEVNERNYSGCIDKWVKKNRRMGGTDYVVVIEKILKYAQAEGMLASGQPPVLVVFQTDGGSNRTGEVISALTQAAKLPIFWQFIGLGENTGFLDVLDDLPGRVVDNVGAFGARDVTALGDQEFYDLLLGEFLPRWLPAARAAGILTT